MNEKCKAALKGIQQRKMAKDAESIKQARRLEKRAEILRKKYYIDVKEQEEQAPHQNQETSEDTCISFQTVAGTFNKHSLKKPKKLMEDEVCALAKRLCGEKIKKGVSGSDAKNYDDWKRKRGVSTDQKVYSMSGWYPSIRHDLQRRGWIENEDRGSPYFDLKWTLSSTEIKYENLKPWQKTNHYKRNSCLTTKTGLLHCIRDNMRFFTDIDGSTFFPRAYDLSKATDMQDFLDDYRILEAEICLKDLLSISQNKQQIFINPGVLCILLTVLQRRCRALDGSFLDYPNDSMSRPVTDVESEVILNCKQWMYQRNTTFGSSLITPIDHSSDITEIVAVLETLKTNSNEIQKSIDGHISKNLWIVKPAEKSRGRGIASFRSLQKILDYVDAEKIGKLSQWCVQKYMETPLLISNRKFDIRQWVLVSSFDPLIIWFYDDCYARFAVEEYGAPEVMQNDDKRTEIWLSDPYRHLVNNSISKTSWRLSNSIALILTVQLQWIIHKIGSDLWTESILPRVKDIVRNTLIAAQGDVVHRENSWELFGYDIMLDDKYSPWLVEINSSPACDYSTAVTKNFIPRALPEILKVVLDGDRASSGKNNMVIGGWTKIHEGQAASIGFAASNGTDINVKGQKLNRPRNRMKNPKYDSNKSKNENVDDVAEKKIRTSKLDSHHNSKNNSTSHLSFDDSDLSDYEDDQSSHTTIAFSAKEGKENNNARVGRNKLSGPPTQRHPIYRKVCPKRKVLIQLPVKTVAWDSDEKET
mmetsp:Transcript_5315/g.7860  ORF Transcript_5315/g.7860 Transcript_5315/m.7860 type:complete len:757 (+) Transcript_5315:2642-4912(+)